MLCSLALTILKNPSEEKLREFLREIERELTREFSRKVENTIEKLGHVYVRFTEDPKLLVGVVGLKRVKV